MVQQPADKSLYIRRVVFLQISLKLWREVVWDWSLCVPRDAAGLTVDALKRNWEKSDPEIDQRKQSLTTTFKEQAGVV